MNTSKTTLQGSAALTSAGLLLVMGVLLPFATSHAFGIPGSIFLPMHLPVLLCGLLCGPQYGVLCGVLSPLLSSAITGMPPVFPMLPMMLLELGLYGGTTGLLYHKTKLPLLPSLLGGMLAGRLGYATMFGLLLHVTNGKLKAATVWTALVTGIPGILLQLLLIPLLLTAIGRYRQQKNGAEPTILTLAKERLQSGEASCVLMKNNQILRELDGRGIAPLLALHDEFPEELQGAVIADHIIGKAAAMLLWDGGVAYVYGDVMSQAAKAFLIAHRIPHSHGVCIDAISNREGNGICPIERSILEIEDPAAAIATVRKTVTLLQAAGH